MPTYTAVLVVSNELDQDYVIEQLERIGVVAFCGPGSLVQDIDPDDEGNLRLGSRAGGGAAR